MVTLIVFAAFIILALLLASVARATAKRPQHTSHPLHRLW